MGVVIRRWVWLECICVVSGWCCKQVYTVDLLILLIPTPLVYISSFLQQHPYFFVHLNVFLVLLL